MFGFFPHPRQSSRRQPRQPSRGAIWLSLKQLALLIALCIVGQLAPATTPAWSANPTSSVPAAAPRGADNPTAAVAPEPPPWIETLASAPLAANTATATPVTTGRSPSGTPTPTAGGPASGPIPLPAGITGGGPIVSQHAPAAAGSRAPDAPAWLDYLNSVRAMSNLPAIGENTSYSGNAALHARYISDSGDFTHYESSSNPCYTGGGYDAGINSNIAAASSTSVFPTDQAYINAWITAPFHQLHMLNPRLNQVGFARYVLSTPTCSSGSVWGTSGVLDVSANRGTWNNPLPPGFSYPLMYPGPGKTTWLYSFAGYETPAPPCPPSGQSWPEGLGAPIVLMLGSSVSSVSSVQVRRNGAVIESCSFNPTSFSSTSLEYAIMSAYNAIVVMPRGYFRDGESYNVAITANGQNFNWTFNTVGGGAPTPTPVPPTPTPVPTPPPTTYTQGSLRLISPVRVLDTRTGYGPIGFTPSGQAISAAALGANTTTRFGLAGRTFSGVAIPTNITGALLNVTMVQGAPSGGYLTVFPADLSTRPNASTVNPSTAIAANFWSTGIPTTGVNSGAFAVYTTNVTNVVVDLVGYWSPTATNLGSLRYIAPVRVVDTRAGFVTGFNPDGTAIAAGALASGQTRRYLVAGKTFSSVPFPADLSGLMLHVTTVGPGGGYVTLFPGDVATPPLAATVNPSMNVSFNSSAVGISTNQGASPGTFAVYSAANVDLIVDVLGYYAPSNPALGTLLLTTPVRVVDTRPGTTTGFNLDGSALAAGPLLANGTRWFKVGGKSFGGLAIPSTAKGALFNVTIVQGAASGGFVTVFPGSPATVPNVSTVNPSTSIAASFWTNSLPQSPTGAIGSIAAFSTHVTDMVVDLVGYYQ